MGPGRKQGHHLIPHSTRPQESWPRPSPALDAVFGIPVSDDSSFSSYCCCHTCKQFFPITAQMPAFPPTALLPTSLLRASRLTNSAYGAPHPCNQVRDSPPGCSSHRHGEHGKHLLSGGPVIPHPSQPAASTCLTWAQRARFVGGP